MRFAEPTLLWLLLLLPVLAALALLGSRVRRRALARFAGGTEHLGRFSGEVGSNRRAVKTLLLLVAMAAGVLAAARPQWGTRLEPITRRGVDVVVVLDTSVSMLADDVAPNRLALARHAAASLLQRLSGNRVALVTFAGKATLACPLTLDQGAAILLLEAVDAEAVPVPGSAIADALRTAVRAFGGAASEGRQRAIVVFSDGEDHEGGIDEAIRATREGGATVHAIGCGTARGSPIPLGDSSGASRGFKKDSEGRVVTTRLDESVLEKLALGTDGHYYRATPAEEEINEIVRAIAGMDARELGTVLRTKYEERFQIPLALALAALLAETVLSDRRRRSAAIEEKVEEPS